MNADSPLQTEADRVLASRILGRSGALRRLFEFLLERTLSGAPPKEIEVAMEVFGHGSDFDLSQDASVRVYIHRLRRKLDDYYEGPGAASPVRLSLPKGDYRLEAIAAAQVIPEAEPILSKPAPPPSRWRWPALVGGLVALNLVGLAALWWASGPTGEVRAARSNAVWSGLLKDDRPVLIVVGDYYIFGDTGGEIEVQRLVREYDVNSPEDLDQFRMSHPEVMDRYVDVDLHYLPVASSFALRTLLPFLDEAGLKKDRLHVVLASDLTPDMIKQSNIVYVGYLSGLSALRDPVFAGSRFHVGENYDELVDGANGRRYISQAGGPVATGATHRDYGYLSSFPGPSGTHVVVIAGTRDIAVMETANAAVSGHALAEATGKAGQGKPFEALYEVDGIKRLNLAGKLVLASPLKAERIWSPEAPAALAFPAG